MSARKAIATWFGLSAIGWLAVYWIILVVVYEARF